MKQPEQPLYLKTSSIYNKIMQLASAIMLMVVLMNMWTSTSLKNEQNLQRHFSYVGHEFLQQAAAGVLALIDNNQLTKNSTTIQQYINNIAKRDLIKDIHLYDHNGLLLMSSSEGISINDLYGISPQKLDRSGKFKVFTQEIRDQQLYGYIRFTIVETNITEKLSLLDENQQSLFRLMLLMAGIIGFLLTRGLNRFSRQGYRLETRTADESKNGLSVKK